jgi:D-arabinose 1-dehydrogenase-like Zn-dependent alcohol dehydrogenase
MPTFTVFKGSKEGKIVKSQTTKPDLTDDQVLIKVTASGLCGTDEHFRKGDMVLGHEGVGVVDATGPGVKSLKKGDRVGWGYVVNSCGNCEYCLTANEQYCEKVQRYGEANYDQGSFASHAVWNEAYIFRIPDSLSDAEAAPLMCGGATVWTALSTYNIKPTDHVGIMGVGGLGHLAIQFAAKMGCNVTVLSSSDSKKEEAMKLGATNFVVTKGKDKLELAQKLNVLVVTTSFNPGKSLKFIPIIRPFLTLIQTGRKSSPSCLLELPSSPSLLTWATFPSPKCRSFRPASAYTVPLLRPVPSTEA